MRPEQATSGTLRVSCNPLRIDGKSYAVKRGSHALAPVISRHRTYVEAVRVLRNIRKGR